MAILSSDGTLHPSKRRCKTDFDEFSRFYRGLCSPRRRGEGAYRSIFLQTLRYMLGGIRGELLHTGWKDSAEVRPPEPRPLRSLTLGPSPHVEREGPAMERPKRVSVR